MPRARRHELSQRLNRNTEPRRPFSMAEPDTSNTTISARFGQMFPVLEPRDIERLRRFGTAASFPAGTRIVKAGEVSPGLIVLLSGKVEVSNDAGLGKREVIVTHVAGQFMGELAQLSARPSLVDADVVEDVEGVRHPVGPPARCAGAGGRPRRTHHAGADPAARRAAGSLGRRADHHRPVRQRRRVAAAGFPDAQRPAPARARSGQRRGRQER